LEALTFDLAGPLLCFKEGTAALQLHVLLFVHCTLVDERLLAGSVKGVALLWAVRGWVIYE
jgi:hypothetical protein